MSVHTSVWFAELTATDPATPNFGSLLAVPDQILGISSDNLVPSADLWLVATAAAGFLATSPPPSANLMAARLKTPKTLISPIYVRAVNGEAFPFEDNPNVSNMSTHPVLMRADEEIAASAWVRSTSGSITAVPVALVAWFWDRSDPVPQGESYWVAFQATAGTLAAGIWSPATFAFLDQTTLPQGRYAIRGMQLAQVGATPETQAVCGRLVIPGELLRPGTLVLPGPSSRPPLLSSDGSLGVWGRFNAQQPLAMEFYSSVAGSDVTFLGYLNVVQER